MTHQPNVFTVPRQTPDSIKQAFHLMFNRRHNIVAINLSYLNTVPRKHAYQFYDLIRKKLLAYKLQNCSLLLTLTAQFPREAIFFTDLANKIELPIKRNTPRNRMHTVLPYEHKLVPVMLNKFIRQANGVAYVAPIFTDLAKLSPLQLFQLHQAIEIRLKEYKKRNLVFHITPKAPYAEREAVSNFLAFYKINAPY